MKTWLKYGLNGIWIGAVVGIVFYILIFLGIADLFMGTWLQDFLYFIFSPVCTIGVENTYAPVCFVLFGHIFNILTYGILGFIIGAVIGGSKK